MKTNLLLITFNRPHYLKKTLNGLKASDFKQVFAFIDGPRNREDQIKINEVNEILKKHGIKNIKTHKINLGMNVSVPTAISWFFENVESGVILEEDCIPSKSFFDFACKMLEKYKKDKRIGMISGSNPLPNNVDSYLFSHQIGVWGWATWRDRWCKYVKVNKKSELAMTFFNLFRFTGSFSGALTLYTKFKRLASDKWFWDINWTYINAINNWFSIIPTKNLITNIGCVGYSTFKKNKSHNMKANSINIKRIKNPEVNLNLEYDRKINRKFNLFPAIKTFIYQTLNYKDFN